MRDCFEIGWVRYCSTGVMKFGKASDDMYNNAESNGMSTRTVTSATLHQQ